MTVVVLVALWLVVVVPMLLHRSNERTRRPVPVAEEATMYPADRSETSEARRQMMVRRRRSLGTLIGGTLLFVVLAVALGGMLWLPVVPFALGLLGYLYFLRNQATRERVQRVGGELRSVEQDVHRDEAAADQEAEQLEPPLDAEVRIDDDDLELADCDTIDLTGLYDEAAAEDETAVDPLVHRRAS
jgi:hypothetical protein